MIHVVLADGTFEEVAGAVTAAVEDIGLVCRDASGGVVKVFGTLEVLSYGAPETMKMFRPQDEESSD